MNAHDLRNLSEAYTQLSAKKDDSYLETDVKKRQKNNEKARKDMEKMGTSMKNPHFEEVRGQDTEMRKAASADRKAGDKKLPPSEGKTNADKMQRSIKFYDKLTKKEETETVAEDDKSYDRNRKRAAQRAADRNAARAEGKTGVVPGVGYVTARKEKESYTDSKGVERHKSGAKNEELDPVGKEDGDVNNDGKKNSTDKYLMKRRAAIGKAMGKKNIRGNDSAEQKARLEKKRGMKLDDHPQFKKEESDHNYVEAYLGELHKGRHGQSEKDYQDSRSNAGKMISGDSKGSGANYSYKAKNTGSNPAGGSKKPQGQARMSTNDRAYLAYQKANLKKEELEATGKFTAEEIEKILEIMGE